MLRKSVVLAILVFVLVPTSIGSLVFASAWPDPINNLDNWTVYHGPRDKAGLLDYSNGYNSAPSLDLLPAATPLAPDPPGFGDQVTSLYWSNPDTSVLANFALEFHICFDGEVGRAFVTFRMQDARNYYAVRLADTHDWTTAFFKFVDDKPGNPLAESANTGIFTVGRWYFVRLEVKGDTLSFQLEGETVLSVEDTSWSRSRMFGIGIYNGWDKTHVHVDDFNIITDEALIFVQPITKVTTEYVTSTVFRNTTDTHTSLTSETRTYVQNSTRTTQLLVPVLDWDWFSIQVIFLAVAGLLVGLVFYGITEEKKVFLPVAVIGSILVGIVTILVKDLNTYWILPLSALIIGIIIGVAIRKGRGA
jgi:hypothetical protein